METISQRKTGGRHRSQGDESGHEGIPAPRRNDRRDDRPTTQLSLPVDPRRLDADRRAGPGDGLDEDPFDEGPRAGQPLDDGPDQDGLGDGFGRDLGRADDPSGEWTDDWDGDEWDGDEWDGDQANGDRPGRDVRDRERRRDDLDGDDFAGDDFVGDDLAGDDLAGDEPDDERWYADEQDGDAGDARGTGPQWVVEPGSMQADPRPRRRRAAPARRGAVRRVLWVAAGIAALVGLVLAAVVVVPGLNRAKVGEVPLSAATPAPVESSFGESVGRPDGWTVEFEVPRATRASDDVDLPADADRGVVLNVVLTNNGIEPRDTAGWTVKAVVGSSPVDVLPVGGVPSRTIRPGASLSFPVAVPMPKATTDLQLEAAPAGGVPSLFVGTA